MHDYTEYPIFVPKAFCGRHVESGENIYALAIREFREETGLILLNLESKGFIY